MDRVRSIGEEVKIFFQNKVELSEENTKMYLILPIFDYLGWNYRSYKDVRAEFVSDVRNNGAEKVDFAIMNNNEPYIFVECKPLGTDLDKYIGQLERYYSATLSVRYGILTDGNKWLFFTDSKNKNLMDKKPFYSVCLEDFKETDIEIFDIFKKDNIYNIANDLRSLLLKDIMQKIIKGEDEDFLNWCSSKLGFKIKSQDIQDLGLLEEAVQDIIELEESEPTNIVSVFTNNSDTSIIIDNKKPKGYRFQGINYKHKNYMLDVKTILEYYIDNDIEGYEEIKSWSVNSGFVLNYVGRKIEGLKLSSMGFCELKNGDSFYMFGSSRNAKKNIIKLLNVSTKGVLDFEFLFENIEK